MPKVLLIAAVAGLLAAAPPAAPDTPRSDAVQAAPAADAREADALHAPFDAVLRAHVRRGEVDYDALRDDPEPLRGYLTALAKADPADLERVDAIALWINAYNAFTLQLILDHLGRIESIKDIPSGKRWKDERWIVGGRRYSLDQIEHEILRPMGDARVHFALVCASLSCPDLRSEAYLGSTLDAQLDDATTRFLANRAKGLRTATESGWFGGDDHNLYLSRIFDWFEEDFTRDGGDVVDFVLPYAPERARTYVREHRDDLDVEYLDYDWSLNDT